MAAYKILLVMTFFITQKIYSQDTLFFKLSNPWNTVKDINGKYTRKCVKENNYFHVWDYNSKNILVTESFFSDTTFTRKLFCHKYFNETKGFLEQSRCYENGSLNGFYVSYTPSGDTASYTIFENNTAIRNWSSEPGDSMNIFEMNEKLAKFPGGEKAWKEFLSTNLQYPDSLQQVKGEVLLQFIISSKGEIEKVELIKGLHPILDQEAIRVILKSPRWKPATQNGKKVKAIVKQPISF